jgi:hypothetical protein
LATVKDCLTIERDFKIWCGVLRDCGVADAPTHVGMPWFKRCGVCKRGRRAGAKCEGARISIARTQRLRFPPTKDGLVPELAVRTRRNGPALQEPEEHSVEVYLQELVGGGESKLVHLSRVDLARGGVEPRYHLHFGGCAGGEDSFHPRADCLRWPLPLYGFVLASELILYTFYNRVWAAKILGRREALAVVRSAEQDYFRLWMDRWISYSGNSPAGKTFLAFSCRSYNA